MQLNYDPNLTYCGRRAVQRVRLTFGQWDYRKTMEVEVGGNCLGMTVINCAVGIAYDRLEQRGIHGSDETYAVVMLQKLDSQEEELECCDEENHGDEWLRDMLIAAEILSIEPRDKVGKA